MKYFVLSRAMRFERFFDSIEEACDYIKAKTGAEYFDYDYVKEHLKENSSYTYSGWGIDLAIYKRSENGTTTQTSSINFTDLQLNTGI